MNKDKIDRFFRSESTPEEAQSVSQYFQDNPESVDEYLHENEWEGFEKPEKLSPETSNEIWQRIKLETFNSPRTRLFYLKGISIAASILIIFGIGWWSTHKVKKINPVFADIKYSTTRLIQNTGNDIMILTLPDSSSVQLMPTSKISYPEKFDDRERRVALDGEAFFNVTHDTLHPFVVHSDAVSTHVLGTQFLITSYSNDSTIRIALFSGHITVEPADSLRGKLKTNFNLIPGEVFFYNKMTVKASVTHGSKNVLAKGTVAARQARSANNLSDNNWYMFNNQPLAGVLDQLQVLYNERIIYSKEDVAGLFYIGKIDKKDTLETILQEISKLNNLSVHSDQFGFYIKKK